MEDCEAKLVNLSRHLRDKHHWSVDGAAAAISVYGLRKPYKRQTETTLGKNQESKKNPYRRKRKICPYCLKNFVRLEEHLIKHIEKGGEKYNNALKNAAIYSPSKYIFSANCSPKKATDFSDTEHIESSNLSSKLSKFDLAKSIDTRTLRYLRVQASVSLLNRHQNATYQQCK